MWHSEYLALHPHASLHKLITSSTCDGSTFRLFAFCDPELTAARAPEKDNASEGKFCRDELDRRDEWKRAGGVSAPVGPLDHQSFLAHHLYMHQSPVFLCVCVCSVTVQLLLPKWLSNHCLSMQANTPADDPVPWRVVLRVHSHWSSASRWTLVCALTFRGQVIGAW